MTIAMPPDSNSSTGKYGINRVYPDPLVSTPARPVICKADPEDVAQRREAMEVAVKRSRELLSIPVYPF